MALANSTKTNCEKAWAWIVDFFLIKWNIIPWNVLDRTYSIGLCLVLITRAAYFWWLECNHDKKTLRGTNWARSAQMCLNQMHILQHFFIFFIIFEKRLFVGVPAKCIFFLTNAWFCLNTALHSYSPRDVVFCQQ